MIVTHGGKTPRVDPSAYVAPNAFLCGDVTIGPDARIMFGAQIIAEGGAIAIGTESIVMENAVLRATPRHSLTIGNNCVIGPNAHLAGCAIADEVFIATGVSVFHAARIEEGCEVRINAVVHLRTRLVEARPCQSAGWLWAIRRNCFRPISMSGYGRYRNRSIFRKPSMASSVPRPTW